MTGCDPTFDEDLERVAHLFRRGKGGDPGFKIRKPAEAIEETGTRKLSCRWMRWLHVAPGK
jgi:hypothetical protein